MSTIAERRQLGPSSSGPRCLVHALRRLVKVPALEVPCVEYHGLQRPLLHTLQTWCHPAPALRTSLQRTLRQTRVSLDALLLWTQREA